MADHARQFGILLPVFSLPTGDMSTASNVIRFLQDTGTAIWQVLPMGPTDKDGSPYLSLSAHAGNLELIGEPSELSSQGTGQQFREVLNADLASDTFLEFADENSCWLPTYSLFGAIRQTQDFTPWYEWPLDLRHREPSALDRARSELQDQIRFIEWRQFQFYQRWYEVLEQCHQAGIKLFGDVPLYVAHDSADVWQHQNLFHLNSDGTTSLVAGVPPDYFSATGQRWGNPLYNWDEMASDGYQWWINRMTTQTRLYDIVRIDHFRGLESYWEIPAASETAETGVWRQGPGSQLLDKLYDALPGSQLVAEDLGTITDAVEALRRGYHLPGIRVLQFAFDGMHDNPHHPSNLEKNTFLYTGTHDNNTSIGWLDEIPDWQREKTCHELAQYERPFPDSLIACAFASEADTVIIPMQDLLHLDGQHRINVPGTTESNWEWRLDADWPVAQVSERLKALKAEFNR